jgi:ketosteroid isomerase-like protein
MIRVPPRSDYGSATQIEDHSKVTKRQIVERFFSQYQSGDREGACRTYMDEKFELAEPAGLPQGGVFRGWDAAIRASNIYSQIWDVAFEDAQYWEADDSNILIVRYVVKWTGKTTGRSFTQPIVELMTIKSNKIAKIEVFHFDPGGLLDTLNPTAPGRG